MTSSEFVIWLKGFVEASNNYNLTPAAWESLKEKLKEVVDNPNYDIPYFPFTKEWPSEPPYYSDPYRVICKDVTNNTENYKSITVNG